MMQTKTIPVWDISNEKLTDFRRASNEAMASIWKKKYINTPFWKRDITPADLGLSTWITPTQPWGLPEVWIDIIVPQGKFIVLTNFYLISQNPAVFQMRIGTGEHGSNILGFHDFKKLHSLAAVLKQIPKGVDIDLSKARMEAYFEFPYVFGEEQNLYIETFTDRDSAGEGVVLDGFVFELRREKLEGLVP
jgi:hypothetical protein